MNCFGFCFVFFIFLFFLLSYLKKHVMNCGHTETETCLSVVFYETVELTQ